MTSIRHLEEDISGAAKQVREALVGLEKTLVRCGYVRDGLYNSRFSVYGSQHGTSVVLKWNGGKIYLVARDLNDLDVRPKKGKKGKKRNDVDLYPRVVDVPVQAMDAQQLTLVVSHLEGFIDRLEENVRFTLRQLQGALEKLDDFIEEISSDPAPADELGPEEDSPSTTPRS